METGGNDRPAGQSLSSEINVTPLVDVMLVVLIIFIVVTPMLQKGVSVALPLAKNVVDAGAADGEAVSVVLCADGQLLLGADPIEAVDLPAALQEAHWVHPARELQIKADQGVAYGDVKAILQAGRRAGFRGAAFIAQEAGVAESRRSTNPSLRTEGD